MSLWKSVENSGAALEACSGCAGDYEDPDRTCWEEDEEQDEGDSQGCTGGERGTVRRRSPDGIPPRK